MSLVCPADGGILQLMSPNAGTPVVAGTNISVGIFSEVYDASTTVARIYIEDACNGNTVAEFPTFPFKDANGEYRTVTVPSSLAPATYFVRSKVVSGFGAGAKSDTRSIVVSAPPQDPCANLAGSGE